MNLLDQMGAIALIISPLAWGILAAFSITGAIKISESTVLISTLGYSFLAIMSARVLILASKGKLINPIEKKEEKYQYDWEKKNE